MNPLLYILTIAITDTINSVYECNRYLGDESFDIISDIQAIKSNTEWLIEHKSDTKNDIENICNIIYATICLPKKLNNKKIYDKYDVKYDIRSIANTSFEYCVNAIASDSIQL